MQVTTQVSAQEIASAFLNDPELAMDVFGELASEDEDRGRKIVAGDSGSQCHQSVPRFLRWLAEQIETNR